MLEVLVFLVALIGSSIAAAFDLKTTEIPDELPILMCIIGIIIYGYQSYVLKNITPLTNCLIWGVGFLVFGWLLYYFGQWGGGDAELLTAMGFLLAGMPNKQLPFPFIYFINLFFVGAIYMIIYAFVLSLKNKKIHKRFWHEVKRFSKGIALILVCLSIALLFFVYYLGYSFLVSAEAVLLADALCLGIYFLWFFAKAVEDVGFKRRIPVSKLKVGDVLVSSKKWIGINEKQLKTIKRSGKKYVWIKEGVRFAPAFPLALLASYFGLGFFWL